MVVNIIITKLVDMNHERAHLGIWIDKFAYNKVYIVGGVKINGYHYQLQNIVMENAQQY